MKNLIFNSLLLVFTNLSFGQNAYYLKDENLRGPVKSFRQDHFQAIDSVGVIVKGAFLKGGYRSFVKTYSKYDGLLLESVSYGNHDNNIIGRAIFDVGSDGQISYEISYSKNDDSTTNFLGLSSIHHYSYDNEGNLIESIYFRCDSYNEISRRIYRYDGKSNLISIKTFVKGYRIGQHKTIIKYDSSNKIKWKKNKSPHSKLFQSKKEHFKYNKQGELIEKSRKKNGQILKELFEYDNRRNIVEETWADSDRRHAWNIYTYDTLDNTLTKSSFINQTNVVTKEILGEKLKGTIRRNYIFDDHLNWVIQYIYENDKCTSIISRDIEYF